MALLLGALDLGDHAGAFAAARLNGRKLFNYETREDLKEIGIDMSNIDFRSLRSAVVDYTSSGVPTALLEEEAAKAEAARPRAEGEKAEAARQREEKERVRMVNYSHFAPVSFLCVCMLCVARVF